jgi:hypothetical protein
MTASWLLGRAAIRVAVPYFERANLGTRPVRLALRCMSMVPE